MHVLGGIKDENIKQCFSLMDHNLSSIKLKQIFEERGKALEYSFARGDDCQFLWSVTGWACERHGIEDDVHCAVRNPLIPSMQTQSSLDKEWHGTSFLKAGFTAMCRNV